MARIQIDLRRQSWASDGSCRLVLPLIPVAWLFAACQTLGPPPVINLPIVMESIFADCEGGEGDLRLMVANDEGRASTSVEWKAEGANWTIQAFGPMGQTTLALDYQHDRKQFTSIGSLAPKVSGLDVSGDGFLKIDGAFVPVKATEVGCLLKYRIPSDWKASLYSYEKTGDRAKLTFYESQRSMLVDYSGASSLKNQTVCTTFEWSQFLNLVRSTAQLCWQLEPPEEAHVKGLKGYEISWRSVQGP